MHMTRSMNKGIPGVFLLPVLVVVCLGITGLANAPVLGDLRIPSITSSSWDDTWVVELIVEVSHDPINEVSSLVVTAYDSATGSWGSHIVRVSIDDPFQFFTGRKVYDYTVTLEIPESDLGRIKIEARAAHGDEWASTSWEGWIPQKSKYEFSGELAFANGTGPEDVGEFESSQWILSVNACGTAVITLHTLNCRFLCSDLDAEIPSWWRVWDNNGNNNEELEEGELIDTRWIPVAEFIARWNLKEIEIPAGWSGEIRFQLKMERSHLADHAGTYSAILKVDVRDKS